VPGYLYDIQITTAPLHDGSLSSCPPAEAVTWGKVDKDAYTSTCVSLQADYTMVMPFLVKALLEKRDRFQRWRERHGREGALREALPPRAATCAIPRAIGSWTGARSS
jgi:deoxyhypusine synthase